MNQYYVSIMNEDGTISFKVILENSDKQAFTTAKKLYKDKIVLGVLKTYDNIPKFTVRQRVRLACTHADVKMGDVAKTMGMSEPSFTVRLKTGKFTKEELVQIADAIGCKYVSYFEFDDGAKFGMSDIGYQIRCALDYAEMSATDLGKQMGLSQQAISKRMTIGKFTQADLAKIASYIGCEYVSSFCFDDGVAF